MAGVVSRTVIYSLVWLGTAAYALAEDASTVENALADYVTAADQSFAWKVRRHGEIEAGEWYELTLSCSPEPA